MSASSTALRAFENAALGERQQVGYEERAKLELVFSFSCSEALEGVL
ncbi:hypothetical protein SHVI106290_13375 [Shewanella violacea]